MKKKNMELRSILCLIVLFFVGMAVTLVVLGIGGNGYQKYQDIVIEWTAHWLSNKTIEQQLIYALSIGGMLVFVLFYFIELRKNGRETNDKGLSFNNSISYCLIVMAGVLLFMYAKLDFALIGAIIFMMVCWLSRKKVMVPGILCYFLSIYAGIAVYRIYVAFGGTEDGNSIWVTAIALALSVLILFTKDTEKNFKRCTIIVQFFIPFSLLINTTSRYQQNGEIIQLPVLKSVWVVVACLMIWFMIDIGMLGIRYLKGKGNPDHIVAFGTCASIIAFNRFSGTGAIMSAEMHHTFENILGYSQIFELGQIPFQQYIPVSGMYSTVEGFFFKIFGNDQLANYYYANNIYYLLIILVIAFLLKKQLKDEHLLLICLMYYVVDYNRVAFILPITLLLSYPRLIDKKNLWLKTWMLSSLFHGLYYPVYGAAVCIGFAPLGIWQIYTYIKSGQLKTDIKKLSFWIKWVVCLVPVVLAIPLLWGTYKHIKAMAGQSMLADGLSRFGQEVPNWFFPYISSQSIRMLIFLMLTFAIPAFFIWVAASLAINVGTLKERTDNSNPGEAFFNIISLVIMTLISFSFSAVRLDIGDLYARSKGMLFAGAVMLVVFSCRYCSNRVLQLFTVIIAVMIPSAVDMTGIGSLDTKLTAAYAVPDNYVYVENTEVERLGNGYIEETQLEKIMSEYEKNKVRNPEASYLGTLPSFGYYYLFNVKGDSVIEIGTIKGYEAVQETIELVEKNGTLIGKNINPFANYYIYHWLLDSGQYYWGEEQELFIPNEGKYTKEEIEEQNKNISISWDEYGLGRNPAALGNSMKTLEPVFQIVDTSIEVKKDADKSILCFNKALNGEDADFMYIEFGVDSSFDYYLYNKDGMSGMRGILFNKFWLKKEYNPNMTVRISWMDENAETHTMTCSMSEGKLLIPLGAGLKWLYNEHEFLNIQVLQDGNTINVPDINNIQFLKLREVEK